MIEWPEHQAGDIGLFCVSSSKPFTPPQGWKLWATGRLKWHKRVTNWLRGKPSLLSVYYRRSRGTLEPNIRATQNLEQYGAIAVVDGKKWLMPDE